MATSAKSVGTRFEREVREYLKEHGFLARKLALSGSEDEGDIYLEDPTLPGCPPVVLQLKARRDAKTPLSLGSWMRDVTLQAKQYKTHNGGEEPIPFLVVKNPNHGIGDAFVVSYLKEWVL